MPDNTKTTVESAADPKDMELLLRMNQFPTGSMLVILDALPIAVVVVDMGSNIAFSNSKAEELLGYSKLELLGFSIHDLVPKDLKQKHQGLVENYKDTPTARSMNSGRVLYAIRKDGDEVALQIGLTPLILGDTPYTVTSLIEVSNKILKVSSFNDPLTGLPNRVLFNEISDNLRSLALRNNSCLGLMFIDLDHFKEVNDQCGHDIGNIVLCMIADIFSSHIRKNDVVGRFGGDEFVLCFYGIDSKDQLESIAHKLVAEISAIDRINEHEFKLGASVGAVFMNAPVNTPVDDIIYIADKLMYKAKRAGKGMVVIEER